LNINPLGQYEEPTLYISARQLPNAIPSGYAKFDPVNPLHRQGQRSGTQSLAGWA
jgi:hypothetical protein